MEALAALSSVEADSIIALVKSVPPSNSSTVATNNFLSAQILKAQKIITKFEQYLATKKEDIRKLVTFQNSYLSKGTAQNKSPGANECTLKNLKYMREFPPPAYTSI